MITYAEALKIARGILRPRIISIVFLCPNLLYTIHKKTAYFGP